jgi:hypothetical protein
MLKCNIIYNKKKDFWMVYINKYLFLIIYINKNKYIDAKFSKLFFKYLFLLKILRQFGLIKSLKNLKNY